MRDYKVGISLNDQKRLPFSLVIERLSMPVNPTLTGKNAQFGY